MKDRMSWTWPAIVLLVLVFAVLAGGCSVVMPSHSAAIDLAASNAVAFNRAVQADANVPPYVKTWVGADANDWDTMSKWGHGKAKTPTTAGK